MTETPKDPPLEVLPDGGTYVGVVVDLDSVRIRHGRTPRKIKTCEHKALIYNQTERRVWCENCERTIDNFDAFLIFTQRYEAIEREASHKLHTANEALKSTARLRATKHLDRAWSGNPMAVCCPHCRGGILPEDFANGCDACSREIEIARRSRKTAPSALTVGK